MLWLPRPFETNWSLTQCRSPFRLISSNKRFPQPASAPGWVQPVHQTHWVTTQIMFVCLASTSGIHCDCNHRTQTHKLTVECDILILKRECYGLLDHKTSNCCLLVPTPPKTHTHPLHFWFHTATNSVTSLRQCQLHRKPRRDTSRTLGARASFTRCQLSLFETCFSR